MLTRARIAAAFVLSALPVLASCTQTANVDDAYMALDSSGDRKRTQFYADTIDLYCIAQFASSRTDVTLEMLVRQTQRFDPTQGTNGELVAADRVLVASEFAPGQTAVTLESLELTHEDPEGNANGLYAYPTGNFQCEIYLDGSLEKTVPFSIAFAACPDAQINIGTPCGGFYQPGDQCPEYGVGSTSSGIENGVFSCNATPVTDDNPTGYAWGPEQ